MKPQRTIKMTRKAWRIVDKFLIWICWFVFVSLFVLLLIQMFKKISDEDGEDLVFNPGEFFEEVSQFYDPETDEEDRLFVKANEAISFNVWDPSNKVLFHRKSPLGKHTIGKVVSDFCKILDLDHRTNHSVRGDCIKVLFHMLFRGWFLLPNFFFKTLRILGYSNEQICKLTGISQNIQICCSFSKCLSFRSQRPQKPALL